MQQSTDTVEKTCSCQCGKDFSLTNILLFIVIVLNSLGLYLLTGNSVEVPGVDTFGIKQALLEHEYDKVGGRGNYDLLTKAQQLSLQDPQNQGNLKAIKQYIETFGNGRTAQDSIEDTGSRDAKSQDTSALSTSDRDKIMGTAVVEGNKTADIVVIEYSDMECPFCVRQYHDTKLWPTIQADYGDKVAFAFKNNRGVNHPGTEAKALGALCAKKYGGNDAYVKFYKTIMDGTTTTTGVYDVTKLADAAKGAGADMTKWQNCVSTKEVLPSFESETAEAQGFGLSGTPGTLILNVKTGKYATVEGAYPYATFKQKIDALMK